MASVDMRTLFDECCRVLDEELKPVHYAELTDKAVRRLCGRRPPDFYRLKEDVREKMRTRRSGVAYVGRPLCVIVKRRWFETSLVCNWDSDGWFTVTGSARCGTDAAFEALLRFPHMLTKTAADKERRAMGCAVGMVREKHVTQWFRDAYPRQWQPPDNEGQWDRPCDHDFKLKMGTRALRIDVAGRRSDGRFGMPYGGRKPTTDVHLVADIDGDDVVVYGVKRNLTSEGVLPANVWPITNFLVWINTCIAGMDWRQIAAESRFIRR